MTLRQRVEPTCARLHFAPEAGRTLISKTPSRSTMAPPTCWRTTIRRSSPGPRRPQARENTLRCAPSGVPNRSSIAEHKSFAEALPKNIAPFQFRMAMLVLALIGFAIVRASAGLGWTLAAIGILIAVLLPVYTGRGAGKVNAVHVLAASTWLGTLLVLALIGIRGVIRAGPPGLSRAELVCDLVNSFSPLALTAAAVVALTGLTTAWMHLKRVSALWTTAYGVTLIVKLFFVLMVVILGAWNWRRVGPSLGESGSEETIRRSSTMELTFAALALLATSVLVTLPSPR